MLAWDRATCEELESYTAGLHQRLLAVQCPGSMLHCRDSGCEVTSNTEERDKVVLDILLAMVECTYTTLPLTGRSGSGREIIPGWSAEVEPFRLKSNEC